MLNARCLNDAHSSGSWQGKNPFLTPGANAPLMLPRPLHAIAGNRCAPPGGIHPSLGLIFFGRTRAPQFAQPSPRTGKGDREAVEEVHGLTGKNNTRLQILASVVAPRTGAKRGMPGASPGVPRRGGRGPCGQKKRASRLNLYGLTGCSRCVLVTFAFRPICWHGRGA